MPWLKRYVVRAGKRESVLRFDACDIISGATLGYSHKMLGIVPRLASASAPNYTQDILDNTIHHTNQVHATPTISKQLHTFLVRSFAQLFFLSTLRDGLAPSGSDLYFSAT